MSRCTPASSTAACRPSWRIIRAPCASPTSTAISTARPTRDVFALLGERVVPGSVLVFDEYFCFASWREDEFKAFQEAVAANGWAYDYLAFNPFTKQAAVVIRQAPKEKGRP